VWGIGTVLYSATVGRPPFVAERGRYAQLDGCADRIDAHRRLPRSHAALADVVASCLERDPARRPPVGELIEALDDLLED
jgi:serine/threonine-protein kinase